MSSVILIAEDEASIADAIEIYLKSQGYQTLKAANGAIAWEQLQNNTVDLAIIDVMMPVMDGIALTMKIRELYEFPIIILSAKSEDIDKITGLNIGADDYVTKPFVPMELLARVHAQLRRIALSAAARAKAGGGGQAASGWNRTASQKQGGLCGWRITPADTD